jgi:hypothetical protein
MHIPNVPERVPGGTSLSIRGCGVVPVKEGHTATRERLIATTF